jgi:hypothetical protein
MNEETKNDGEEPIISIPLIIDFFRDESGVGKGYLSLNCEETENGKRLYYRWSRTKERATLEEAIALVDKYKKPLPDDEESFNKYYSQYRYQDEERLIYSEFNHPWNRIAIEVKFCCLEGVMPTCAFANIEAFSKLLLKSTDQNFINFMISGLSSNVGTSTYIIKDEMVACGLSPDESYFSSVLKECDKYEELWERWERQLASEKK